jgi:hypothetical protein
MSQKSMRELFEVVRPQYLEVNKVEM